MSGDHFYSVLEASQALGMRHAEFRTLIRIGKGPPTIQLSARTTRISATALKEWIKSDHPKAVYVGALNELGPVKIGSSWEPHKRLSVLSQAANATLSLYFAADIYGEVLHVERRTHEILREHCDWSGCNTPLTGEWFNVDVPTAIAAIIQAANELGHEFKITHQEPSQLNASETT
jgi:hypothetical protein